MNIEIQQKGEDTSWEELTNLLHESFQERIDQGMHFSCSYLTPEDFERCSANAVVLLAIDKDKDRLAGTASVVINRDDKDTRAYFQNMAIHPDYKHRGVGSKLEEHRTEIARVNGCKYVTGDTAVGAKSSINLRKKYGFKIIGLLSWPNTNYYSYVFRKQLVPHPLWSNDLFCKIHFWFSSIICRLKYKANGEHTSFMKWYIKLRNLI